MTKRGRLTLGQEFSWMFGAVAVVLLIVSVLGIFSFRHLVSARRKVIDQVDPANVLAAQLLTAYVDEQTEIHNYSVTGQILFLQDYEQDQTNVKTTEASLASLLKQDSPAARQLNMVTTNATAWQEGLVNPTIATTQKGGHSTTAPPRATVGKNLFDQLRQSLAGLQGELADEHAQAVRALSSASDQLGGVLVAAFVILVLAGLVVWLAVRRRIIAPLTAVGGDTRAVTAGDLDRAVQATGPMEIAELAADIEAMRLRILEEVASVSELNVDLVRSNEELEQFAYVASHDLQEPLRKVTSFCQLLQQRYAGQLDERADQYIDFAVDGAKRMQVLINDLLAFSRIGRTSEHFQTVDLESCARAAVTNLATAVEDASATIEIDPDLPAVHGDRGLIISLFQNLIGNAIKFRRPDQVVGVWIAAKRTGDFWEIAVTDDGIGIEARFADRIFVIFQRLHGRDAYSGTGIGLAMCKKIVEFHGGRIWLDTDHHPGTRFCFTLPAVDKEEVPVELDRSVHAS